MHTDPLFHELAYYTLGHPGNEFIHQHAVDAYTAQMATGGSKPIAVYFALAGLYLHLEKGYTGKEVQYAHVTFSRYTKDFPCFQVPRETGNISIADVLNHNAGPERDSAIENWCHSVWNAWYAEHEKLIAYTDNLIIATGSRH